jgi:hypothetical protein
MPKHTPAAPLEYRAEAFTVKAISHGQWYTVARTNEPRFTPEGRKMNAAYLAHAANAYPKLVEALREAYSINAKRSVDRAYALLRELGEE